MLSSPPIVHPENTAFFFDFDGTLTDGTPEDDATLAEGGLDALMHLNANSGGAIAIVTERQLGFIDGALAPLRTAIAGLHGTVIRRFPLQETPTERIGFNDTRVGAIFLRVSAALKPYPELHIAFQESGVSVSYKANSSLKLLAVSTLENVTKAVEDGEPTFALMTTKTNVEIRPLGADKGTAIRSLMRDTPFKGRQPFFAGDDTPDEAGFDAVNAMQGISVKIGPGPTRATYRLSNPAELIRWLEHVAQTDARVDASDITIPS